MEFKTARKILVEIEIMINIEQEEKILALFDDYLYNGFKLVRKSDGFELTLFMRKTKFISNKCNELLKKIEYKIKINYEI